MEKRDPELQITIKKLVTLTLLEVFKDLLPNYQLKLNQFDGVKCKWPQIIVKTNILKKKLINNLLFYYKL